MFKIIVFATVGIAGCSAGSVLHQANMPHLIDLLPAQPNIRTAPTDNTDNEFLKYGYPGPVSDFLLRSRYAASYNRALRNPNWVAEHLTRDNLKGTADRTNADFKEDTEIPPMFRALLKDYYRSGFDRGHMCPAADAKKDMESMKETFILTNIAPQVGIGFNRNYWAYLEAFVRGLTNTFDDVYCISGPLYLPVKEGDKWFVKYQVIGDPPNVPVPTHFFKAILTRQGDDFALGTFALPNEAIDNSKPLTDFAVPPETVEKAAGLTLFDKLDRKSLIPLCDKIQCTLK
ncbi:nuclease [Coemansia erecta]|nr:nuclease [Coemansia sp. RSA 2618]KAJ2823772.1 nuclease [Coemansia erecta]